MKRSLAEGGPRGADAELLATVSAGLQRLGARSVQDAGALARHAEAMGLFMLEEPGILPEESARETRALILVEVARHHRLLAWLVAAHHHARRLFPTLDAGGAPVAAARRVEALLVEDGRASGSVLSDVPAAALQALLFPSPGGGWLITSPGQRPGAISDQGLVTGSRLYRVRLERSTVSTAGEPAPRPDAGQEALDAMAMIVGRLSAGHALASRFAQERQLFRQRLIDVPAVEAWVKGHAAVVERLAGALSELTSGRPPSSPAATWEAFARDALETASGMTQLMGGTGLMEDSQMPGVYREVIALIQAGPGKTAAREPGALAELVLGSQGPGGVSLET